MRRPGFPMRFIFPAAFAVLAACGGGGSGPAAPDPVTGPPTGGTTGGPTGGTTSNQVGVGPTAFTPSSLTVPVNTTVTWKWDDCDRDPNYGSTCVSHSVTFDDAAMGGSGVQDNGTYQKTFPSRGSFKYHCAVHGASMAGTVTVQ